MNIFLIIVLAILIGNYLLHISIELINLRNLDNNLPEEFKTVFDDNKYRESQEYIRENTRFDIIQSSIHTPIVLIFLLLGGFNYVDNIARSLGFDSVIVTGVIFTGILVLAGQIIQLPFSIYDTFLLEEKYGFNNTNGKTFVIDIIKGLVLMIIIGSPIFGLIILFFERGGDIAWLYAWLVLTCFQLTFMFLAPVFIMPLFNKFTPLEDGELKTNIEDYAKTQDFQLEGVYKMDGSKRSTKSNAFFTGFGKFRRIVLLDTLIEKHSVDELVAILAHEMGHFKKKHVHKFMAISIFSTGLMLYILSAFINNEQLFQAFKIERVSVYASIVIFGFLYTPISTMISIATNYLSRKYEFEADRYAAATFGKPESLIDALKKLSADNMSNLTPHPLKIFLEYSHPPVLQRIEALNATTQVDRL